MGTGDKMIEIINAFNEWWEKHQLDSSSMDKENAMYAFKYGYKSREKEIKFLKKTESAEIVILRQDLAIAEDRMKELESKLEVTKWGW